MIGVCSGTALCSSYKQHVLMSVYCHGWQHVLVKGKAKGLDTCYSATYMSQTRDQQHFTISEVAADWHEPTVPQRIMWPLITRARCS